MTFEQVIFGIVFIVALGASIAMLFTPNAVHTALFLVLTQVALAVAFLLEGAYFIAALQIILYAGAIMVLFLFVIMLLGVDRTENVRLERLPAQRPLAYLTGVGVIAAILLLARTAWVSGAESVAGAADGPGSNIEKLARSLFTRYLLPFEMTSVLLVIAVVGAVVLARHSPSGGVRGSEDS